jgi:hypothetical protein
MEKINVLPFNGVEIRMGEKSSQVVEFKSCKEVIGVFIDKINEIIDVLNKKDVELVKEVTLCSCSDLYGCSHLSKSSLKDLSKYYEAYLNKDSDNKKEEEDSEVSIPQDCTNSFCNCIHDWKKEVNIDWEKEFDKSFKDDCVTREDIKQFIRNLLK